MKNPETAVQTIRSERPSLRVPKRQAQQALQLLSKLGVLDRDFRFNTDSRWITLPMDRQLDTSEIDQLLRWVPEAALGTDEFERREKVSRTVEESLSAVVPPSLFSKLPRSYDIVGEVAIVELGRDLASYEKSVANAILEVYPNVRAVYAKAGPVSGLERIRPLRHLAGEDRIGTIHREFGCSFKVDLSKAFFSPRLSTEHDRVAGKVGNGESVVDMFAGVGPFSILIARRVKHVTVNAIDSNPEAVRLMEENVRLNRVVSKIRIHQGDARNIIEERLRGKASRVIMNHPSASEEFVDVACDALHPKGGVVHYYTFGPGQDPEGVASKELEHAVKRSGHMVDKLLGIRKVREVAPVKWQMVVDARIVPAPRQRSRSSAGS